MPGPVAVKETHKARKEWLRWAATPSDIAEVARTAENLVARTVAKAELRIKLDAPAWESEFIDVGQFLEGLRPGDLADVAKIEVHAYAGGCSIAVSIERSKSTVFAGEHSSSNRQPVVRLSVAGPERDWVYQAQHAMEEVIGRTGPSGRLLRAVLLGGVALLGLGVVLLVAGSYGTDGEQTRVELVGAVLAISGVALSLLAVLSDAVLPLLDLRDRGTRSRREKLAQWSGREGGWLARTLVAALIGAGVTLLIQQLA